MTEQKRPLLITTGEPAGIGMDVVLNLAAEGKLQDFDRPIWVTADASTMQVRAEELVSAGVKCLFGKPLTTRLVTLIWTRPSR